MHFQFGANGIEGFTLNGTQYIYQKNILGDIIGIFDSNQQLVAKYTYDAWGNQRIFAKINNEFIDITQESTYTNNVANVNPIRYRGYYYDVETGFYYLNSRYYDPSICRFINADDISYLNPEILNGLNLYAYCGDNPINNVDYNGKSLIGIAIFLAIGFILGGIANGIKSANEGSNGWNLIGNIILGAFFGLAVAGLIVVLGSVGVGVFSVLTGIEATFFGVPVLQAFAIGALAYNTIPFIIAPILGKKMEGIEVNVNKSIEQSPISPYQHSASLIRKTYINKNELSIKIMYWRLIYDRIQRRIV